MASLWAALEEHPVVVAPGVADPLSARLVERHGFPAVYVTGHGVSALRHGLPDLGLIGRAEMAEAVAVIARATPLPLIADADTGYGGPASVRTTVRDLARRGASALHLEDQTFPKRCGYLEGGSLVAPDEMCERISAALDARESPELAIIARTEARLATDLEDTIARAVRYHEAGAELVFVNAPRSRADVAAIARRVPAPLLYNNAGSGASPTLTPADAEALGYRVLVYPTQTARAAMAAVARQLAAIRDGAPDGGGSPMAFAEWLELTGADDA